MVSRRQPDSTLRPFSVDSQRDFECVAIFELDAKTGERRTAGRYGGD